MLNAAQLLAVANADAHASNAGLPSYSELVRLAGEAAATASFYVPARQQCDHAAIERCLSSLEVFTNTNGREQ